MQFAILYMRKLKNSKFSFIMRFGKYISSTAHFQILNRLFQGFTDETPDFIDQSKCKVLRFPTRFANRSYQEKET